MALATSLPTAILISSSVEGRDYQYSGFGTTEGHLYNRHITTRTVVEEYVALTKTLAQTTAEAASQSGLGTGDFASYVAAEDQRTIGSYKLTKTTTYAPVITTTDITPA
jgi:hypothetical protein